MSLLHGFLDLFTVGSQLIFPCILLRTQLTLGQFEVVNFDAARLFVLLGVLRELLKLVFLVLESLGEVLDSASGCLNLLLHAIVFLE